MKQLHFDANDISNAFQVDMPTARAAMRVICYWGKTQAYKYQQWLDKHLLTFGVERVEVDNPNYEFEAAYLNAGESYQSTLIFHDNDKFGRAVWLWSWGDLVETYDNN